MNILHAIPYLGRAQGGPVESLRLLASAQADAGNQVRVVYTGKDGDGELIRFPDNVQTIHAGSFTSNRWSPKFIHRALSDGFVPDVVHSHGLWLDVSRQSEKLSKQLGAPHIISPCGMLQKDALERSKWKKRIAWFGFQNKILLSADIIHAKSEAEASEIRNLFPQSKIKVVPNPIETPSPNLFDDNTPDLKIRLKKDLFAHAGILPEHKILLFMGRVHPVKGLEHLLKAWAGIYEKFPDWRLVIIGPDESGFRSKLKSMIRNNSSNVVFVDPLFGEDRWAAYANADLFVAPSDFENFGQSIAEALATGIPVITTTGTPWKDLKEKNCGWWIDSKPESIADALQEAMSLSETERKAKGEAGKNIVEQYLPSIVAEKMCQLYKNIMLNISPNFL